METGLHNSEVHTAQAIVITLGAITLPLSDSTAPGKKMDGISFALDWICLADPAGVGVTCR